MLENGFNVMNGRLGQGGDEFGRQAYVGLSTAQFGTATSVAGMTPWSTTPARWKSAASGRRTSVRTRATWTT